MIQVGAGVVDYDYRGDVYSCGVVLLVLTHGMLTAGEIRSLHGAGLNGLLRFRKTYGKKEDKHSDALMELLEGLLRPEPARLTAREALASPWLGVHFLHNGSYGLPEAFEICPRVSDQP